MGTEAPDGYEDVSTNAAAAAKAAEIAQSANFEEVEIPSIPAPRDGFARLPGGVIVDGQAVHEIEVQELTGSDEERIHKARTSSDPTKFVSTILECGTAKIGKHDPESLLDDLLVGDREYLLLAIREATYGPEIDLGQVVCNCGDTVELTVDVHDIPVHSLDSPRDRQFEVKLRKGGKAVVQLPTGADQRVYMDDPNLTPAERNSLLLSRCVLTLTDAQGESYTVAGFPSLVRDSLGIADRNKILNEIANRQTGPRYDEVEIEHECGYKMQAPIGLRSMFPGL